MSTLIPGFLFLVAIVIGSLGFKNLGGYMEVHSLLLVVGGTAAIFALSTPMEVVKSVWRSVLDLFARDESFSTYQEDLTNLASARKLSSPSKSTLLNYASELWQQGVEPDLFVMLFSQKKNELDAKASDSVHALKNLAKYPPALGMIGTVVGMVALFANLDQNQSSVGANLSLAMTATFFGLIMANVFISPLADRVHVRQVQRQRVSASLYEIVLLINRGEPTALIGDEVTNRAA